MFDISAADLERRRTRKVALRRQLLAGRAQRSAATRAAAAARLTAAAFADPVVTAAGTVAAYVSVGTEPSTRQLLGELWARGTRVLLPVLAPQRRLDWAAYTGETGLADGPYGLLQPIGPRLGPGEALADLWLVPALAVDRRGNRIGQGGGYYDRFLAGVPRDRPLLAVVYAEEVLDGLPAEAHDIRVHGALTDAGLSMF